MSHLYNISTKTIPNLGGPLQSSCVPPPHLKAKPCVIAATRRPKYSISMLLTLTLVPFTLYSCENNVFNYQGKLIKDRWEKTILYLLSWMNHDNCWSQLNPSQSDIRQVSGTSKADLALTYICLAWAQIACKKSSSGHLGPVHALQSGFQPRLHACPSVNHKSSSIIKILKTLRSRISWLCGGCDSSSHTKWIWFKISFIPRNHHLVLILVILKVRKSLSPIYSNISAHCLQFRAGGY